ncbi:MAG: DNA polymerase I [Muribaculaceae bacterium]|nr:DNA polymerase I [Muribaculaceae bacterium]
MEKRLFLLDAYALIYRAYYALIRSSRMSATVGFNTAAVYGFCNTLDDLLRKENPTHIAVCFDPHGPTFRHKKFEAYKAQRDKQPEDITLAIPWIKRILEAYRIPVIEVEGYEADDVIGTLSTRAASEGYDTFMMTPDKDYGQLVGPHVFMYRPALKGEGFEVRDTQRICEIFGVSEPRQVIDLLALEGDKSDNIPGCPGVGETTAQKLIAAWGSVENLLDNTDSLKGALKVRVEENAEQIRMSKWLATICRDVPIDISIDTLERKPIDIDALMSLYQQLDFRSLIARLKSRIATQPSTPAPPMPKKIAESLFDLDFSEDAANETPLTSNTGNDYTILTTAAEVGETIDRLSKSPSVGVAVYAVGEDAMSSRLDGMALSAAEGIGVYIPIPASGTSRGEILAMLAPLFGKTGPMMVGHDIKRAMLLLKLDGIEFETRYYDTSVAHYVIDPESRHKMADLATRYLHISISGADPNDKHPHPTRPLTVEAACARYCEEADLSLRLRPLLDVEVAERAMTKLLNDVEFPLIRVLAEMEWTGVRIDSSVLLNLSAQLKGQLEEMEQEAYRMAGGPFNLASPSQVGMVLFDRLEIDPRAKRTSKGQYSTTEQVLEKYAPEVPLVSLILKIRRLRKLITTYLDTLPALINPRTGKIHTSYNQTVTATGRISSTNPNLQNIPVRTEDGREIRRAFIADPGDILMSADYSQIELRLIADLSGDKDMIEAFLSGEDIHRITASKIYGVPLEEVTDDQRRHAKTANFGIVYGISAFGLSERLRISRGEAKKLIDGYFATYPHIREYLDRAVDDARKTGYAITRMGRRRYLPDINSRSAAVRAYAERNAVNAPIQGTAADIIKVAMVRIFEEMERRGLRSRMIMQVHDELIFNVVPDELEEMRHLVEEGMAGAYQGAVPLIAEAGTGHNWLEAH